jgi:glucose-6-phosphate dehydrogenase assembly protein OpcA
MKTPLHHETWTGVDVTIRDIERELQRLRSSSAATGSMHLRTSVLTHIAWVPREWRDAAEETLQGLAERHPSRTLILTPEPTGETGIDAELALRSFAAGQHAVYSEVISLTLRGATSLAPASIALPLLISDLPVFLRWRGRPDFGGRQWRQLIGVADRVVIDTSEWDELRPSDLGQEFEKTALSDIAWARTLEWRRALAARWPEIRDQEIRIAGPLAEAELLRGWLVARLERGVRAVASAAELSVSLDGVPVVAPPMFAVTPSDRLSAELDRFARDPIYEAAVRATA